MISRRRGAGFYLFCCATLVGAWLILLFVSRAYTRISPAQREAATQKGPGGPLHRPSQEEGGIPAEPSEPSLELAVGRGGSLMGLLQRAGFAPGSAMELCRYFGRYVDLNRLHPDDRILVWKEEGHPRRVALRQGPFGLVVVELNDKGGIEPVGRCGVELTRRVVALTGEVRGSLFGSMERLGEEGRLALGLARIFSSQIDFNTESQDGDLFGLVVEKYYDGPRFVAYGLILAAFYSGRAGEFTAYAYDSGKGLRYYDDSGAEVGTSFLRSPLPLYRVTSRFSRRRFHPILHQYRQHLGVDLAAPMGTPVRAVSDGVVAFVGWRRGFGRSVIISHRGGIRTYYGHLSRYAKGLHRGRRVKMGEVIGRVGMSGLATGPHLDYRIRVGGRFVNPFETRFRPRSRLKGKDLVRFRISRAPWKRVLGHGHGKVVLHEDKRRISTPGKGWLG